MGSLRRLYRSLFRPALGSAVGVALAACLAPEATAGETPKWVELHKPNYFVYYIDGPGETDVKFQLSVRTPIVWTRSGVLFLGYTQESFWELFSESSPFREHDFNPELFWKQELRGAVARFQLGVEHQSTGVAGVGSRGWDRAYGELAIRALTRSALQLTVYPKLWWVLHAGSDTEGIKEYTSLVGKDLGGQLILVMQIPNWTRVSLELGRESRFLEVGLRFARWQGAFLYAQLWDGPGDGLMAFDDYTTSFGFGIKLFRMDDLPPTETVP